MADIGQIVQKPFGLNRILYDTRYRSYLLQIFALVLFASFLWWIFDNVSENFADKKRIFGYSFLFERAGYDINQTLIYYGDDSTHLRAAIVGLLNTLVVAVLGCIFATILGVFLGIMRLSKNWLIGRIATVYVEMFRNIPLLLWLLLVSVVLTETQPNPVDFRVTDAMKAAGQAPKAQMLFDQSVAITSRGINVPAPMLANGLAPLQLGPVTLNMNVAAVLLLLGLGIVAVRQVGRYAARKQAQTGVPPTIWWINALILCVPTVALLYGLGFYLDYPRLTRFNFVGGVEIYHSFTALLLGVALYTSAFIAEIVRAGILAVSHGQTEAALALGLRPGRTMRLIVLPQALRVIIPPLISEFLSLTKNTSLGVAVSYFDLRGTLGGTTLNQTGRDMECMLLMMAIYLTISLIISVLMNMFNHAVRLKER